MELAPFGSVLALCIPTSYWCDWLDFHQFSHVTDTYISSQPLQHPYEPESGIMVMGTVSPSEILEGSSTTRLHYQSDGPGFDPRWYHLGFFLWFLPTKPCALRSAQPLKMSTRDFSWGKGNRCVWLTTYHPCSAERPDDPGP